MCALLNVFVGKVSYNTEEVKVRRKEEPHLFVFIDMDISEYGRAEKGIDHSTKTVWWRKPLFRKCCFSLAEYVRPFYAADLMTATLSHSLKTCGLNLHCK